MISCNLFRLESDIGTSGLRHLLTTGNAIKTAVLSEQCPRLLEVEGDIGIKALLTNVKYPIVIAYAGIAARLSANRHLFTPLSIPVHRGIGGLRACSPER